MWTEELQTFEATVRRTFAFLCEQRGYSEPEVYQARDFGLIYAGSPEHLAVDISLERDWFVPFILLGLSKPQGLVWVQLQEILEKLGIPVDTSEFPLCEKISRKNLPGLREIWIHLRRKKEIVVEYPRMLEAYAAALRSNYDAVAKQVDEEPVTIPGR